MMYVSYDNGAPYKRTAAVAVVPFAITLRGDEFSCQTLATFSTLREDSINQPKDYVVRWSVYAEMLPLYSICGSLNS